MKKNQLLALLVLLLVMSLVFTACSKTDVVGKWKCEMTREEFAKIAETSTEMLAMFGIPEKINLVELEFTEDGKFSMAIINPKDGSRDVEKGTYTVSGKTVTMTSSGDPVNVTINGKKLILKNEEMNEKMVFIKQ
jgi:major membrane immunogen (membrane-anchored lipoprotein)